MQLSDIRKALFGCNKNDVFRYVAEISGEFSARLKSIEEANEKRVAELEGENLALQEKMSALTAENAECKAKEDAISKSIVEANLLAERIKAEAEEEVRAEREAMELELELLRKKASAILSGVAACKNEITSQLEQIKTELADSESLVSSLFEETKIELQTETEADLLSADKDDNFMLFQAEGGTDFYEKKVG